MLARAAADNGDLVKLDLQRVQDDTSGRLGQADANGLGAVEARPREVHVEPGTAGGGLDRKRGREY